MRSLLVALCGVVITACVRAAAPEAKAPTRDEQLVFTGMCDASGAVVLDAWHFAVADDEDNIIRIYDVRRGGEPVRAADLSGGLDLPMKKQWPETDIEAATGLDSLAFWLTSHGRKSSGKLDSSRFRFFATKATAEDGSLALVGQPYMNLVDDLVQLPELRPFDLEAAAALPPKTPGGLNIEGMTAMEDGASILIGLRSPVPEGKALVVPLRNPVAMLDGERAQFGRPRLLDLGGAGIRAISWWRGRYLFVGGSVDSAGTSRLFTWRWDQGEPAAVDVDFTGWNPEGFVSWEDKEQILVLSDDGSVPIDGVECKRLKEPGRKRFRARWVPLAVQQP